jgi:hypothetical protein
MKMGGVVQTQGTNGSLKWIQHGVNECSRGSSPAMANAISLMTLGKPD